MNTDNSDDDFELMTIVDQRIATALEDSCNSRERDHHLGNQHPRENLTAPSPHNTGNTKSLDQNNGFDLMGKELGFPKSHNQASRPARSLMCDMEEPEQVNIQSCSIGMTSLRRM
ncbi:expressed unknown protein [Seminavis robusta]|uniref:Uncharacterized protein n=1 Tax=Seminavis robusta TaxID=568900 RepID=A0A9N8DI33_9STRA|nr:expressed unknown protein [Seminavis robusta]|eukprot:Sro133_g062900.1 n/a (115) ;mRNA; r:20609-20953